MCAARADPCYGSLPRRPVAIRVQGEQAAAWWGSVDPVRNHWPQLCHSPHSPLCLGAAGDRDVKAPGATVSSPIPLPGRGEPRPALA